MKFWWSSLNWGVDRSMVVVPLVFFASARIFRQGLGHRRVGRARLDLLRGERRLLLPRQDGEALRVVLEVLHGEVLVLRGGLMT